MVTTFQHVQDAVFRRVNCKTLDQVFLSMVEIGAKCPPFVSNAILTTAKKVYNLHDSKKEDETLKPGQLRVIGVLAKEPAGKPLKDCQLGECTVTLDAGAEDQVIREQFGVTGLRRAKLLRITTEAHEQGIDLTQEDLAYRILNCGLRTVRRDIAYFKQKGIFVPTRGQQKDIGPGVSHKVLAVKLLLERKSELAIARTIYHSLAAIERYTVTFARVVFLSREGLPARDIAFLVQNSERLVKEYQQLYQRYNKPEYEERLSEILSHAQSFRSITRKGSSSKKNGQR